MLGLYTPLLILQAICIYHAYRNNAEQRWYWFIIFFPLIGCLIYLYHNFYNRNTVQTIAQGMNQAVNSNYRVEQLEKAVRFADNVTNKIRLADEYMNLSRYAEAITLYKDCLNGFMAEDPDLRMKIVQASFFSRDYASAIVYSEGLENDKTFKNSEARIAYAWALHCTQRTPEADVVFKSMNRAFTNYQHRLEYGKFLKELNKLNELKELLGDLTEEFSHMKSGERKLYRNIMYEVKNLSQNE